MSELLISEEEFFEKSNACKDALMELSRVLGRNASLGINNNLSEAVDTFERSYGLIYNAIRKACRLMIIDWNVIEICVTNLTLFDRYLSAAISGDNALTYYSYGCDSLWNALHAYDVELEGADINENTLPTYRSSDTWTVMYYTIHRLDEMRTQFEGFADACDSYRLLIDDYSSSGCVEGNMGDAIKQYLLNVHSRLIDYISSVAQEFVNALAQYCDSYFAEFPETGYYLNRNELQGDLSGLSDIAGRYSVVIGDAISVISTARSTLNPVGVSVPYAPTLILYYYSGVFASRIAESSRVISSVIETVDGLEERGRILADDSETYISGLRASLEYITPMGGYRVLHYHSLNATDILDVPNTVDVTEIEADEPLYNNEAEYLILQIQEATPETLPSEIDSARRYLLTQLPEGTELSDEAIMQWIDYYNHLIAEGYDPDEAQLRSIVALECDINLLLSGDYEELDAAVERYPDLVRGEMVYFVRRVADEDNWGYELGAWGTGSREEVPDLDAKGEIDCSHLVLRACEFAGIDISACSYTGDMLRLENQGFTVYACSDGYTNDGDYELISMPNGLQPGDILLNEDHHAAMYVGDDQIVEAVHNEYGTGHYEGGALGDTGMEVSGSEEVVRCDYHDYSNGGWHYVLRYTG